MDLAPLLTFAGATLTAIITVLGTIYVARSKAKSDLGSSITTGFKELTDQLQEERNQLSECRRAQAVHQNGVGRSIAIEHEMVDKPIRRAFGLDLLARFSKRERLGLRKDVRQQHIVMPAKRVERLSERNKITRNEPSTLMDQLIKGMLAIGSRLAPIDRAGLSLNGRPIERYVFAVALHCQLLEIGRETLQVLIVGQHRHRLGAEEVVIPDAQKAHQRRQVAAKRRGPEMLVDRVETRQHVAEMLCADGQHG